MSNKKRKKVLVWIRKRGEARRKIGGQVEASLRGRKDLTFLGAD